MYMFYNVIKTDRDELSKNTIHGVKKWMATFTLTPPAAFNFRQPEDWKKWHTRFEQFRIASGLSTESGERQVSSLLYCMGVDAVDVLATTNISDNDKKDYSKVVKKFNEYFNVQKIPFSNVPTLI